MGAEPKRRYAKGRQGRRRAHLGLTQPSIEYCPQCNNPKLSHHACPTCGSYAGREAVEVKGSTEST